MEQSHPIDSMSTAEAGSQGQCIKASAIAKGRQFQADVRKADGD